MNEKIGVEINGSSRSAVISFKGSSLADSTGISSVWGQIKAFLSQRRPSGVVVDFSQVKFFSSQVLGMLVDIRSLVKVYGGEVAISSIEPHLYRVFEITNLDKLFNFFPDKDSAARELDKN